ncbi:multicopper oxidase [Hyaloscypha hepaticicola]|uniref:Multicopper oxidase n=1 Tax=Hyaloscypha hepaticicola TaxID=2082293 RepID=A0A2J6PTA1_9HELO|nr:multicopper oxidase [Hyaloscypha hepaticicola]
MLRKLVSGLAWATILPFSLSLDSPRQFQLTVTWENRSPDGFSRNMILVNGQSPGPAIEINEGEEVWVTVLNQMPFPTTMHYHGIEMLNTPWSDGVPGVTQREIPPGGSFLYKWKATQYGAYWYHAHRHGQLDDGQYGPLTIHPKENTPTPFSLISQDRNTITAIENAVANAKPIQLTEWRHLPSDDIRKIEIAANMEVPCYDSLLINGKGKVDCWSANKTASLLSPEQKQLLAIIPGINSMTAKSCLPAVIDAKVIAAGFPTNISGIPPQIFDICTPTTGSQTVIEIKKGESESTARNGTTWVALNVIGAYSTITTTFSIDELPMWVYAVDGEYIIPQLVNAITITNGDRYSVLVQLNTVGDYTIRHASTLPVQLIAGQATLSYRDGREPVPKNQTSKPYINEGGTALAPTVVFYNQTMQKAFPPSPVADNADQTFILTMGNTDAAYKWALNGTSQPQTLDVDNPILFKPQPNLLNNLTITTRNNTWIDLIFVATHIPQPAHPIHKHSTKMWLIGSGHGVFKWPSVAAAKQEIPQSFNLVDPPKRDGFSTLDASRGPTWTAVRYHVTNPGAWFLHCHIQSHLLGGMSIVIQDGIDHWPTTPPEYLNYKG